MLSQEELVRLNQETAEEKVLSVYLNAEDTDPAERRAWRVRLNGMLKELDAGLAERPARDREAVRAAAALIEQELEGYAGLLPERGWTGFATPDRLLHAAPSPTPMPDLVRWEDGAHVTPYVRALKQSRPVVAVVADRRRARVFRYLHGELGTEEVIQSDAASDEGPTRSGWRGEAGSDAARRSEEAATQRMLREVVDAVSGPLNSGHLLVAAGTAEATAALLRTLPDRTRERAIEVSGVRADASNAELKEAVESAASTLSSRLHRALVDEVLDTTRSGGRACLGRDATERALQQSAVDTLVVSRTFARTDPDAAERLVDQAYEQSAVVEEISEADAAELDREGGIGARLRFVV